MKCRIADIVKERNEALFSLDRKKIENYMIKYGNPQCVNTPDLIFWAGVYKAICEIKDAPAELAAKARGWLKENGFRPGTYAY